MGKLPWNNISIWASLIVILLGGGIAWGTNSTQTNQNAEDIKALQEKEDQANEQQIRMEERQKQIQRDVQKLLLKVEELVE